MLGNLHVRFGVGDEETCLRNGVRRFIPTQPATAAALFLSQPSTVQNVIQSPPRTGGGTAPVGRSLRHMKFVRVVCSSESIMTVQKPLPRF